MSNKPVLRDRRLRIMEGVLVWEGEIGNARVRRLFDIQPVQASRLLGEFRSLMGDKIVEDGRAKVLKLMSPESFDTSISLEEYARHTLESEDTNSCVVDARLSLTEVQPAVFSMLRKASLNKTGVLIRYASMTNPDFQDRTIFPHSIIHVGRRWHVRAWCAKRQDFRDFTLGRIKSVLPVQEITPRTIDDDDAWQEVVMVEFIAHRMLSRQQQQLVEAENFCGHTSRFMPIRACLVQYILQDLRAAINPSKETPPEFQIEVGNPENLKKLLF